MSTLGNHLCRKGSADAGEEPGAAAVKINLVSQGSLQDLHTK